MNDDKDSKWIGCLWLSKDKSYLSGDIKDKDGEKIRIIVFKNNRKRQDKQDADYMIYLRNQPQSVEPF